MHDVSSYIWIKYFMCMENVTSNVTPPGNIRKSFVNGSYFTYNHSFELVQHRFIILQMWGIKITFSYECIIATSTWFVLQLIKTHTVVNKTNLYEIVDAYKCNPTTNIEMIVIKPIISIHRLSLFLIIPLSNIYLFFHI